MKFTLIVALALIGCVVADVSHLGRRPVLDSATQGPNPQDIATPEPEYIDIDLPEPPRPAPVRAAVAPRAQAPVFNTIPAHHEPAPAHVYSPTSGYRYKRPVSYYRRTHRLRY
ncbi:uncharacterized protein LOC129944462 [Eupeodes corollae]|uniref:uncharacterized protein LOC129944462 n=1 Tax=Eupeodes corollae TaxID=290404 RepID=UPI00249313E7|nr:uncharacterized protein LOC129944462 [Eupeodes corollae]